MFRKTISIVLLLAILSMSLCITPVAFASSSTIKVDFVFFIDSTGSMRSYISSIRNNLLSFSRYLQSQGVDARFSVIEFKDVTISSEKNSTIVHTWNGSAWTSDVSLVETTLEGISATGGGDDPETPTHALDMYPSGNRSDASLYAFLLTDAEAKGKSDDSSLKDLEEITHDYNNKGIHCSVVSKKAYENHYEPLYGLTGGIFIDIDSSNYFSLMSDIADWVVEQAQDSDGDGLPDEWEINGVDVDGDGVIDLNLRAMGADPNVPDIFIEVDYMYRPKSTFTTWLFKWEITLEEEKKMLPDQAAFNMVMDQFLRHGIHMHIDAGPSSIMNPVTRQTWGSRSRSNAFDYQSNFPVNSDNYTTWMNTIRNNFDRNRWHVFRHCLCVDDYDNTGSSGISILPGQFFIVAGEWVVTNTRYSAGTFMHELGHTLGLGHGGNELGSNYKPNYLSIMSYTYQLTGLLGTNAINYSEYALPMIDTGNVNESNGIDPNGLTASTGLGAKWYLNNTSNLKFANNISRSSIDFNDNGTIESNTSINFYYWKQNASSNMISASTNDWNRIKIKGGGIGGKGIGDEDLVLIPEDAILVQEITYKEAEKAGLLGNPGDCSIESISPETFYSNAEGQFLTIRIRNLFATPTTAKLKVQSALLLETYSKDISLDASETKDVAIPLKTTLPEGPATVTVQLTCESGTTVEESKDVAVYYSEPLNMAVGETKDISKDENAGIVYRSQDTSIVSVEDGSLKAKKVGTTIVDVYNSEGKLIGSISVVVSTGNDTPVTGDPSHPAIWILLTILSVASLGFIWQKFLRKNEQ